MVLPGGPGTTIWTLVIFAAVIYPAFWALGLFMVISGRRAQPAGMQRSGPLSWFEREQVTVTLRAALAQGRLTEEEHAARVAQVPAAQSRAGLAALTADLPADLTARLPKARHAWTGICVSTSAAGVLAALVLAPFDNYAAFATALLAGAAVLLLPPITVGLVVDALYHKRTGGQLRLGSEQF